MNDPANNHDFFDVIVVGAGPAGCEAAAAAARLGARTLCLAINLDSVALHPAGPVIADGAGDPRTSLLEELHKFGGLLPEILPGEGATASGLPVGMLAIDRRRVSLAYKERLELVPGVWLRQALVTSLEPQTNSWTVATRLAERFSTACVIIAAGTFLRGVVDEAGISFPGGRPGEIAAIELAGSLDGLGIALEPATATCYARLGGGLIVSPELPPDGETLHEAYALGIELAGSRAAALAAVRARAGLRQTWLNRAQFTVHHLILSAAQVGTDLQARSHPGLFFTGRAAGCCNYVEAATLGLIAGTNAAAKARKAPSSLLIEYYKFANKLAAAVADQKIRPVTVRRPPPGC